MTPHRRAEGHRGGFKNMKTMRGMWPWRRTARLALALLLAEQSGAADSRPLLQELSRQVEHRADHTVTFVRVRPPQLPKAPPPAPQPEPSAEEHATVVRRAGKPCETLVITANVHLGQRTLTELCWSDDSGATHRALSNVDFRLLTQLTDVETKDAVYLWFPFVCAVEGELAESVSATDTKRLNAEHADYVFLGSPQEQKAAAKGLDLLDHLHAYAQLHESRLRRDFAQREADEKAAEAKRQRTPPASPTIYYWLETGAKR